MPPPKQKPTAPILPVHSGRDLRKSYAANEILVALFRVELGEELRRLFLVARIAAQRRQRVRRERDEVLDRKPARDILDVRIEAAVLVDHQHARAACRSRSPVARNIPRIVPLPCGDG